MQPHRVTARARAVLLLVPFALVAASLGGCAGTAGGASADAPSRLVLASTTSTYDSGLLDELIPAFEEAYPEYDVELLAVGTGEALALGETKDADVLLVHARGDEEAFVASGFGTERADVMHNDFVLVGPPGDPAGVTGASDAADALETIAGGDAPFVSRGDGSGTHQKEKALWEAAGVEPSGDWYVSAGQGMGDVLRMASELAAYTITDRATYLNLREGLELDVLFEGDPSLLNTYGVIPVAGAANPSGAQAFLGWVTGPDGQSVIETYGVDRFGQPLFFPNAEW